MVDTKNQQVAWHALITQLYREDGHRFAYHRAFQEACALAKIPYTGYTNQKSEISHIPHNWERCLRWEEPTTFLRKCFLIGRYFTDFRRIFCRVSSTQRLFFLESYALLDLFSLALSLFFLPKKDRFFFLLRSDLNFYPKQKRALFALLLKGIKRRLGSRFIVLGDTEEIVAYYRQFLKVQTYKMPVPHTSEFTQKRIHHQTPIAWWAGPPRWEKGEESILKLAQLEGNLHLVVSEDFPLNAHVKVSYLPKILSRKEYEQQMLSSDVLLFPYDPKSYFSRTSGIFIEGVIAGTLPVVKKGSWLSHECLRYNLKELIVDWDSKDLLFYIEDLLKDEKVQKKFVDMQADYRKYHTVEQYARSLSQLAHRYTAMPLSSGNF